MPDRALTDIQITLLCDAYMRGESGPQLAARYYVDVSTVYYWLHIRGVPVRPRRTHVMTLEQIQRAYAEWKSGRTICALAADYRVHRTTMSRYLHNKYLKSTWRA